jgi:phosphatidylglycerol lysyltransferase
MARTLARVLPAVLFAAALAVLHREVAQYGYRHLAAMVVATPGPALRLSVILTALAYAVLVGYDMMALRYARHPLPLRRTAFGSFIAYAFSQTMGLPLVTGPSVRYRLWSSWGLSSVEIAKAVGFIGFSFGFGMLVSGGVALVLTPAGLGGGAPGIARAIGGAALALVATYVAWGLTRRRPIVLLGWSVPMPTRGAIAAQLLVPALDWGLAGAALYVLLPAGHGLGFLTFLAAFLLAQFAGLLSHVPGGLGVFESILLLLLKPYVGPTPLLGALVAYRGVYYLLPFAAAVVGLAGYELRPHAGRAAGFVRTFGGWAPRLLPQVLSGAVFLTGAILLLSGATPPLRGRLAWLAGLLPLGVIELSHFAGSLAGAALLVLAWGLWHRLDAAYGLTLGALAVGIGASLLKGADWEEASVLLLVLGALVPARRHFYRQATLLAEPLEPGWVAAIVAVVGASIWLGLFAHQHVPYRNDLWWRFALHADAPRFLRATVGAVGLLLILGLLRLVRHTAPQVRLPDDAELARAAPILATSPNSSVNVALLGDKAFLYGADGRGLLMYAVSGRSWVALGDPIGDERAQEELAWRFRELADRHGGRTVFYEVGVERLPLYIDLGLTLMKLGEDARVPLASFSLDGSNHRALRRTQRQMERAGVAFEVIPAEQVAPLVPELRAVSDAWLRAKRTREKGFSLGRFTPAYVSRFPTALVRANGRIVAFATVWTTPRKTELSVDLMRHLPDAPGGVMQFIFTELMLWGREQGYGQFRLGMAPLSGLRSRTLAPLWSRAGAFMYRHGEHFYNFQGLREYKEKFDPVWEPRYLASPGGLALPRILANVAALIGGGVRGVVAK